MTIILDTSQSIDAFCMLARRGALKLEILGMRRSGRSAYAIIKELHGFKGNKESVLAQYEAYLRQRGILS